MTMIRRLMTLGELSFATLAASAHSLGAGRPTGRELSAYPTLRVALDHAERSGVLAAERRRLAERRLTH